MAKRAKETLTAEEKRPLNKANLKKLTGIFVFMRPYLSTFILGLIALVVSTLTLLAFPRLAGELLNVAKGESKYFTEIYHVAFVLMGILFFQAVFGFIRVYTFSIVSEKGMASLRKAIYEKYLWLPMSFYDSRRVGELMSRITADVATLQDTFSLTLAELLRQVLTLVLGTAILFVFAPNLTIFMLLTFPVLVIVALIFGKYIRKLSKKTQDTLAETNVVVEESLQSISIVKAFTNERIEQARYGKAVDEVVRVTLGAARYRGLFISFIIFAIFGGIVAVGTYGAILVKSGTLDVGELFSFVLYTALIGFSIAGLGDIFAQLQRSIGASERVMEILQNPDEHHEHTNAIRLKGEIEFNRVSFAYEGRPEIQVLKDLNFKIRIGEKIALIGKSGSGKSTIISLLLRFYTAHEGSIKVDGKNILDYGLSAYRANLGIVPQEVILFGGSIADNIRYGKPDASVQEIEEAARKANALEFIDKFPQRFDTLVGERGVKLSGGQRQRIAIARAILKDPAILILDEATSSLDVHSEVLVQTALEKLMEGRTTIVIAHRLSTIKKVDRILVIQDGTLAEMGSHSELTKMDEGIYTNLLKLQLQ
jgi:ATP-binding cassette, subfamily B, bacterial